MTSNHIKISNKDGSFHWLDVFGPTPTELENIAHQYGLHPHSVQDSLDPEHLPKFEIIGNITFLILRSFDETVHHDADTVQDLTRKVAVFLSDSFIITIHKHDHPYLEKIRNKWKVQMNRTPDNTGHFILNDILRESFSSFGKPIDQSLNKFELFEMGIFKTKDSHPFEIEEGYFLKRKIYVIKRILRLSQDVLNKFAQHSSVLSSPQLQDLKEILDSQYFYTEELLENVTSLLNIHISLSSQKTNLASHKTNEVMRVLTIFSVFFMPLNFIASIYGMNFEFIPELKFKYGYYLTLSIMASVSLMIYLWFKKKGWLIR